MRTVIFVYQSTPVTISTCETNAELCPLGAEPVTLTHGDNAQTFAPGTYKIVSSHEVRVAGDTSAFDVVVANTKTNDPTPPSRAISSLSPAEASALQAFLAIPDAKVGMNP
jgi:hypothetical protein